ncbi:transposase, Ptta/En/Spm, plant [Spatholobus suberectus]|nr:transposase, Ptta/En/Spm, plant [Spatholobus suberectus]
MERDIQTTMIALKQVEVSFNTRTEDNNPPLFPYVRVDDPMDILKELPFYIKMRRKNNRRSVDEQHHDEEQQHDEEVHPYILQLINLQNYSQFESQSTESNHLNNSASTNDEQDDEAGSSETRNVRGPTLLRDIWTMPPEKTIDVQFNSRNQAIGKKGRKLASFLGIVARTPELTPLNVEDWRCFDKEEKNKLVEFVRKKFSIPAHGEEFVKRSLGKKWKDYKCDLRSMYLTKYKTKDALLKNRPNRIPRDQWIGLVSYWVSNKGKRHSQANRSNRAKQKMPHTRGSKSIGTLMSEKAKDGIEPTRAEVFILTHKKRKDGRPLDEESIKALLCLFGLYIILNTYYEFECAINRYDAKKLNNGETSNEQHLGSVAWEGDVYSQVFGSERSGYIRGLGLGPTPSLLWGNKSSLGNISTDNMSNETIQKFKEEVKELKEKHDEEMNQMKELNQKQDAELNMMKQNQEKLMSELSFMRQVMCRFMPTELPRPNFNGSYFGQVIHFDFQKSRRGRLH